MNLTLQVARIVKTPLMKFLSYTCSYLTFLVLITVVKLYLRHHIDTFSCETPDTVAYLVIIVVFMWISGELSHLSLSMHVVF